MRRSRKRGHGQPCHQSFINRSAQAISRSTPGTWSRNAVLRFLTMATAAGGSRIVVVVVQGNMDGLLENAAVAIAVLRLVLAATHGDCLYCFWSWSC